MNGVKLRQAGRAAFHAASLLLTAWALIATSAPDPTFVPTVTCYSGIAPNTWVQLTLSSAAVGGDAGTADWTDLFCLALIPIAVVYGLRRVAPPREGRCDISHS